MINCAVDFFEIFFAHDLYQQLQVPDENCVGFLFMIEYPISMYNVKMCVLNIFYVN